MARRTRPAGSTDDRRARQQPFPVRSAAASRKAVRPDRFAAGGSRRIRGRTAAAERLDLGRRIRRRSNCAVSRGAERSPPIERSARAAPGQVGSPGRGGTLDLACGAQVDRPILFGVRRNDPADCRRRPCTGLHRKSGSRTTCAISACRFGQRRSADLNSLAFDVGNPGDRSIVRKPSIRRRACEESTMSTLASNGWNPRCMARCPPPATEGQVRAPHYHANRKRP